MPIDEQRALWAAIRANPADETPRLVYADWLQEHGDEARAEFIRVQCELGKLPYDRRKQRKRRAELEAKESALLAAHKRHWVEELRAAVEAPERGAGFDWTARLQFGRGFLAALYLNLSSAARLVGSGHEPEPIHYFEIGHGRHSGTYSHADVAAIAAWKFGSYVNTFSLAGATDEDVRAFLAGGRLARLWRLDFWSGSVSDAAVTELANSPLVAPVKSMCLSASQIGDAGALALADSVHLPVECNLNLYGNAIGPAGRARLRERFPRVQIET
jgi:uncharacterized protein (TIGR02996 family)